MLPGTGSIVALPTNTVLLITPFAGAFTVNPRLVDESLARFGTVQNTFVKLALVVPPPVALMNVNPTGNVSVTTRLVAVEGPVLVTKIVYVNWLVDGIVDVATLTTCKSACGVTAVTQFELLLLNVGSPVTLPTIAVLVMAPLAGAWTVNPRFVEPPLARLGTVQNTFVKLAFVAPPPVALIKVRFAGKASVTTKLVAVEGPRLVTVIV